MASLSENPYVGLEARKDWPLGEAINMHIVRLQQVKYLIKNISQNYIFAITGWPCQQETRLQHLDLGGGGYSSHIGVFCLSFHNTRQEKTHMKLFYSFNCLQEIQNNCPFIILKFLMFSEVDSFSPSFVSAWRI